MPQMVPGDVAICERQDYPCWGKSDSRAPWDQGSYERWVGVRVDVGVALELPYATLGLVPTMERLILSLRFWSKGTNHADT